MTGKMTDLVVAGQLAARAAGRRIRAEIEPPPDLDRFSRAMEQMLAKAPDNVVRDYCWVYIPATRPPWVDTNMTVDEGDELSYFAEGRVYVSPALDIYVPPSLQLWCKIGDQGEVFRGTRSSHSFRAPGSGPVSFGNYFPNDWADPQGARKESDDVYGQVSGELLVLVIRWNAAARDGLRALGAAGDPTGLLRQELERIEQGNTTPEGWHYLWHLGPAEIYRKQHAANGDACIACMTHGDVGILQRDVDLPLEASTEISWAWCVQQLPSTLREDTVPSHDYLSIAVEFDNGRDITYYWSSNLPVGTGYDCPLPNWAGKEFHVVVRSGDTGLGRWHNERRNLYNDYLSYMGTPPARVVRVWLIANSIFQRGRGVCDYADIRLKAAGEEVRVL